MSRESYRFTVRGRVQGVYFRQSTADLGKTLGLDGWVRNLQDGRVEGVACGEAAALRTLREWLDHGPPSARVEAVEWTASVEQCAGGFVVRR